ncbi:acyl-CoA dehydrogenase family protein [Streptomyces sp. RB6PN25]|uniref:Acyl-CoA dehydrogenase family protein n=1 Tax=Streptomyces humicola TaxID=2953240 RepID=A0ABT1PVU0_9ACTN|nr:acyl-CoA dehydrogenase [Streptomyces humicola]MCQ4080677.1 acyl-CoA dehydrogenase family protein [Streptomyces humicola]
MRLGHDRDQQLFAASVRALLGRECMPEHARAGFSPKRWEALAGIGVPGLLVPGQYGGLGLGAGELAAVAEEAGRACAPEPVIEAAVAAALLTHAADGKDTGRAADWLRALADGGATAAVALCPAAPVAHAVHADFVLVARDDALYGMPAAAARIVPVGGVDPGRALGRIDTVVRAPGAALLLATGQGAALAEAARLGAIAAAADLLGSARAMLDLTVQYAGRREQFGRSIGTYQAVKHKLADVLTAIEFARPTVLRAAHSYDHALPSAARDAAMAKVFASDAADLAARACLQVHGAIGYTEECDLSLWLRRVWALSSAWGDAAHHRAAVADDLLGPDPAPACPPR